ncbi:MAG: sodium:calcium antiporter [Armatimonadota bacterium]
MLADIFLLAVSFLIIILGAELFTNGVEWLGVRLRLSEGAVGSVLAAVGTALPETLIPIVALIFFREASSHEIGLGAILGAPFMLATLGFCVTATAAVAYRRRRTAGIRLALDRQVVSRDLGFFLPPYALAIAVSFAPVGHWVRWLVAACLLATYALYLYLNLSESAESEKKEPLTFNLVWAYVPLVRRDTDAHARRRNHIDGQPPRIRAVTGQIAVALGLIIGGAYQFVEATRTLTELIGVSPLVFSLIVAPIATELPEKFNSVIWVRQGRDTLSMGNISGAMVFQSTFPVMVGMLLTPWHFQSLAAGGAALLSAGIALVSAAIVLAWIRFGKSETVAPWPLLAGLLWWLIFLGYVLSVGIGRPV